MYLLDTTVPSELRKGRRANGGLVDWVRETRIEMQYLSVVTVLELRVGALRKKATDPKQAAALHGWIDSRILPAFEGRVLPVTREIAERCAPLHVPTERDDLDMLIAATALEYGLIVVTRNIRHFAPTGVMFLNPWSRSGL